MRYFRCHTINILVTVIAFLGAPCVFANSNPSIHGQIQDALNHYRIANHIVGMSMSVVSYEPNHSFNYVVNSGNLARNRKTPVHSDNLFQVGSMTKSFTAATLLRLEANPKYHLNINQKLTNWLPQYKQWKDITIKQLLNHTSGIYNYVGLILNNTINRYPNKHWTYPQLVTIAYQKPLYFKPGTGWHYSNTNYVLIAMIIEKATGRSFQYEMQQTIKLAGLHNTYYFPDHYPGNLLPRMVHGYNTKKTDVTSRNLSWAGPAGAVVSNAADMSQWLNELLQPGMILSDKQLNQMKTVVNIKNGKPVTCKKGITAYGFGILCDNDIWWHDGSMTGYSSIMMHDTVAKYTIVILSNTGNIKVTDDFHPLAKKVGQIIGL